MISLSNNIRIGSIIKTCRNVLNCSRQNILYNQSAGVKTLEERLGLPPKPKKPLTPYFRYMQQMRPVILEQNPKIALPELVKLIASKWEQVDDKTKMKLQEDFKKDQVLYIEKRAQYDSKLSDEQRRDLKHLKQEISDAKERRAVKKRIKELGKPKKPLSAFLRFLGKERKFTPQGTETFREWQQKVVDKWTRLTEAEKDVYKAESKKEMEVYKQEISKWEEKMIRLGHIDVVRHDALLDSSATKQKPRAKKSE